MTKRFGFTLAEVLITLGIIGVVAAMTIPTLMNQTGEAEFKTGFKKIISTLNQAVTMNVALDNTDLSQLSTSATATTDASLYTLFNTRMNVVRTSTNVTTTEQGVALTGTNYTLYFNDGMAVSFLQSSTQCTSTAPCKGIVDVNGTKKPNKLSYCATASTNADTNACATTGTDLQVNDQFSIKMFDQQVIPNGQAARNVMYR